jgi:hypothetical protein
MLSVEIVRRELLEDQVARTNERLRRPEARGAGARNLTAAAPEDRITRRR